MSDDEVLIEEATAVDDELVAAFELLIPQLSRSNPPPDAAALQAIVDAPLSHLLIARDPRDDHRIVGSMCLAMFRIPTGLRAWIEDVVVDEAARGRGVGEKLNRHALETRRRRGRDDGRPHQPPESRGRQPALPAHGLRAAAKRTSTASTL